MVTWAPATARPCVSVIVPRRDEEPVWAKATLAVSSARANALKRASALDRDSLTGFMHSSIGDFLVQGISGSRLIRNLECDFGPNFERQWRTCRKYSMRG